MRRGAYARAGSESDSIVSRSGSKLMNARNDRLNIMGTPKAVATAKQADMSGPIGTNSASTPARAKAIGVRPCMIMPMRENTLPLMFCGTAS